jgi:5-methylcytosine-specific restriction endonuclease McrA
MGLLRIRADVFDSPAFVGLPNRAIGCWVKAIATAAANDQETVPFATFRDNPDELMDLLRAGVVKLSDSGDVDVSDDCWSKVSRPRSPAVRELAARNLYEVTQCAYCRKPGSNMFGPDGNPWHMDHVVPISSGGADDPSNIVKACKTCNLEKGSKRMIPNFLVQCGDMNTRGPDDWICQ